MITSFLDLEVYQKSLQLSYDIEELIRKFPKQEQFLLVDQMRRASRSIPALIAEGYAKKDSLKTFQKYLRDAVGETNGMIAHLQQSTQFGHIKPESQGVELIHQYDQLGKKLTNLKDNWQNFK